MGFFYRLLPRPCGYHQRYLFLKQFCINFKNMDVSFCFCIRSSRVFVINLNPTRFVIIHRIVKIIIEAFSTEITIFFIIYLSLVNPKLIRKDEILHETSKSGNLYYSLHIMFILLHISPFTE